jgi:CBS domain-containing protein
MQVQQIMNKEVHIADPNMTIRDLARQMRADNIGSLPVGENDRLIGMVTDRDIVVRALPRSVRPETLPCARLYRKASVIASRTTMWSRKN